MPSSRHLHLPCIVCAFLLICPPPACSNGKFFCNNRGFKGQLLHSSAVNDGICDCCDGSDEVCVFFRCFRWHVAFGIRQCACACFCAACCRTISLFDILSFQWKIVSGSACPDTCESTGSHWRRDTLSAIERHESGVGLQAQLMSTASAKLAELQSQQSQKQAELESLRVFPPSLLLPLHEHRVFLSNPAPHVFLTGSTS